MKLKDLVNHDSERELDERIWVERVDFWIEEYMRNNKGSRLYNEDVILFFMWKYGVSRNFARYCVDMHVERRFDD